MITASTKDFREAARRRLPRFLFDYIDGGADAELTLRRNISDLIAISLRQRVLTDASDIRLDSELFGRRLTLPVVLGPVGMSGMYARRGEVQAARSAARKGVPYCLSTVSICPLDEVINASQEPIWFQLYVLRDRGFMRNLLETAQNLGVSTLLFTVDMPVSGTRYRDAHSGLTGPYAPLRQMIQAFRRPAWALDVGLLGRPHTLGNVATAVNPGSGLKDYMGWIRANFDPSVQWSDLTWVRELWKGQLVIKGVLDPGDAKEALALGADGIVVSNHGGRQLDGALSVARALPHIVDAVGERMTVLADSGIRSGGDIVRMLALGAKGVLLGRAYVYALAARGEAGLTQILDILESEMRVVMALTGVRHLAGIDRSVLAE